MSSEENHVIRDLYRKIHEGDLDALREMMTEDMVEHEELPIPDLEPNREGVIRFFAYFRSAFPDFTMAADDIITEGDRISVRGTISGTHEGEFMGIPATGNRIMVPFADFFRLADGRVAEHWGLADTGIMLQQLGALEV